MIEQQEFRKNIHEVKINKTKWVCWSGTWSRRKLPEIRVHTKHLSDTAIYYFM